MIYLGQNISYKKNNDKKAKPINITSRVGERFRHLPCGSGTEKELRVISDFSAGARVLHRFLLQANAWTGDRV